MAPTAAIDRHKAIADWIDHTRATARKQGVPERHIEDFVQDWVVAMLTEKEPSPKNRQPKYLAKLLVRCARFRAWRKLCATMEVEPAPASTGGVSPMMKRARVPESTPANLKERARERLLAMRAKSRVVDEDPQEDVCR